MLTLISQLTPVNNVTACERMIFRQGDDDPFAPHRKRLVIPPGVVLGHTKATSMAELATSETK